MRVIGSSLFIISAFLTALSPSLLNADSDTTLNVLWSSPIIGAGSVGSISRGMDQGLGFGMTTGAISHDGNIFFLGARFYHNSVTPVLLAHAAQNSPEMTVDLQLSGALPEEPKIQNTSDGFFSRLFEEKKIRSKPSVGTIALGRNNEIWVGGTTNVYMDIASASVSDAYLARIGEDGRAIWEKAYGLKGTITSISVMSTGDLAVFGGWGRGWLARLNPDGKILWEKLISDGFLGETSSLPSNSIVVAGLESNGSATALNYRDDVSVWIFDNSGTLTAHTTIRPAINVLQYNYNGTILISTDHEAIYVASGWDSKPIMVSKLNFDGQLLWNKELSVGQGCSPSLSVSSDGEPLLVCSRLGKIHFFRFDKSKGNYSEYLMPTPTCQGTHPANVFVYAKTSKEIFLSGSRVGVGDNCSWLGTLSFHG